MSEAGGDIIIKKIKKSNHAGHHGGAWKIAYADFVTAMMAFFLMLWLLSSISEEKLKALSEYFTPTIGLTGQMGIGFKGGTEVQSEGIKDHNKSSPSIIMGAPKRGPVVQMPASSQTLLENLDAKNFTSTQNDLYKAIHENPELKEFSENIAIEQTPEGLRIQILDNDKRAMFEKNTDILLEHTKEILVLVASFIRYLPNYISIDGHTSHNDIKDNDNWIISALRAESTRKFITDGHIEKEQIFRIVGKGDVEPYDSGNLNSESNNRISIVILKNSLVPMHKKVLPDDIVEEENNDDSDLLPFQEY